MGTAPRELDGGSPSYRAQNVYLRQYDGEETLRARRSKIASGAPLGRADAVRLALIPLMRLGALSMERAVEDALGLPKGLPADREQAILAGTVIGLCERFLSEDAARRLIDMARTTTPFDDLLAEMLAKGRAEGEAKGMAEGAVRARTEEIGGVLRSRFGQPRPDLTAKIVTERDLARLDHWFELACKAPSLADFERDLCARQ